MRHIHQNHYALKQCKQSNEKLRRKWHNFSEEKKMKTHWDENLKVNESASCQNTKTRSTTTKRNIKKWNKMNGKKKFIVCDVIVGRIREKWKFLMKEKGNFSEKNKI